MDFCALEAIALCDHSGTECSGLESVMVALEHMGLGDPGKSQLQFICEEDAAARKFIFSHRAPACVYDDVTVRQVCDMPTCDFYSAGFPCQPFFLLLDLGKANMIGMGVGAFSRTSQSTSK